MVQPLRASPSGPPPPATAPASSPKPLSARPCLGWDKQLRSSPQHGSFLPASPLLAEPCPFPDSPRRQNHAPCTRHSRPQALSVSENPLLPPSPRASSACLVRTHTFFPPRASPSFVNHQKKSVFSLPPLHSATFRPRDASLCELRGCTLPSSARTHSGATFSFRAGRGTRKDSHSSHPERRSEDSPGDGEAGHPLSVPRLSDLSTTAQHPSRHHFYIVELCLGSASAPLLLLPASDQSGPVGPPAGSQAVSTALCVPHTRHEGLASCSSHPVSPLPLIDHLHRAPGPGRHRPLCSPSPLVPAVATSTHTAHVLWTPRSRASTTPWSLPSPAPGTQLGPSQGSLQPQSRASPRDVERRQVVCEHSGAAESSCHSKGPSGLGQGCLD